MSLDNRVDVVIYGAGYTGLSAGYRLVKEGKRVVIVEVEPGISHKSYYGGVGLNDEVFIHNDYLFFVKEYGLENIREAGNGIWVNGLYLLTSILKKFLDLGGRIVVDTVIEPIYSLQGDSIILEGVALNNIDDGLLGAREILSVDYLIDTTHNASLITLLSDRLKLDIPINGYGAIIPGSREIVEKTSWILQRVVAAGLSIAQVIGAPLPFPDIGPLLMSGWKAAELVLKGFNPANKGNILYPWII